MKYRAVIFDLDGTLLNTLGDIALSTNIVLKKRGYPEHDVNRFKMFVGDGMETLIRRVLPENVNDESIIRNCLLEFKEEYAKSWKNTTDLYPGIREMLNKLQGRNIKTAVLSNKPHEFTITHVEYFLSEWEFDAVFGIKDGIPRKPDPSGALEISKKLSIPPNEFIYVGDTNTDMKTAINAGIYPVGVLWGFRDAHELIESGAKKIIKKPGELLEIL